MAEQGSLEAPEFDFARVLAIFARRRWIIAATILLVLCGAFYHILTTQPVYSASALVLIDKEEKNRNTSDRVLPDAATDDYYQTQYRLLRSRTLLKKVYASLSLETTAEFGGGVGALEGAINIFPIPRSRLVNVICESTDPALAARISNSVSESYVAQNLENKLFISKELLQIIYGKEKSLDSDFHQSLPAVVNNTLIQSLKSVYANLEVKLGDFSSRYTADHPERIRLKAQMDAVKTRIQGETEKAVKSVKAELSGQMMGNNVRIIDPAEVPTFPTRPRKYRIITLAFFLGLISGFMLAFIVENIDQTVRSQEDIEGKLGLPFLGSVPKSTVLTGESSAEYDRILSGPNSYIGESLRNVRTMIGFAGASKEIRVILVTSTIQGEGKSFLAINLAMIFNQLGKKILLIEGDLRRPSLHRRFELSREKGLSQFLAHGESESELPSLIQNTPLPNLQVLVCGAIPPNPAELLTTPRMKALLEWSRKNYDYIIIDGTPVFPITDALLWGRLVDAAIFVAHFGKVNAKLARLAKQKLEEGGMRIAGAVINQVSIKTGYYYYGDYNYYYQQYYSQDSKKV